MLPPRPPPSWLKTIKRHSQVMCRPHCCINYGWTRIKLGVFYYTALTAYGRTWIGRALNWSIKSWEACLPVPFSSTTGPLTAAAPKSNFVPTSHVARWAPGPYSPPLPKPFPCSHTPTLPNFPSQLSWPKYWEFLISRPHHRAPLPMLPIPLPCRAQERLLASADPE